MSRTSKILTGIFSFLPIVLFVGIFITAFLRMSRIWRDPESAPIAFSNSFSYLFLMSISLFLLSILLLIFFIIQVARNKKMDSTERAIWILTFVLGGAIAYPIYWYMKIWKEDV